MRIASLAALGLILIAAPAIAQDNPAYNPKNFGAVTCRAHVPCPNDSTYMTPSDLGANATQCVASYFGLSSTNGFFEDTGLDANGCLTKKASGANVSPACCVIKLPDNSCTFHCELTH